MLINHEQRFVFVHVPKTGGSSIREILEGEKGAGGSHRSYSSLRNQYKDYYSFGFVRNPWDRMVSLYHFCIQKQNTDSTYNPSIEDRGFKESLMTDRLDPGQKDSMWYLEGCSFIGRIESFQEDFDVICENIGIGSIELIHKNISDHSGYRQYYDQDMIDYVASRHCKTIEHFGYDF